MASNKAQKIKEQATKLFSKGKWDKALEAYTKLTKVEPQDPKNFQKVAELQLKLDMKQAAIDTYKKACDQFMARGFLIQAIAICKIVIQLSPEEKEMEDRLAELYAKRGIPGSAPPGKGPYLCVDQPQCRDQPAVMGVELQTTHLHGMVLGSHKIVRDLELGSIAAYDLAKDPEERHPLQRIPTELREELEFWEEYGFAATGDSHVWPYDRADTPGDSN